MNYGFRSCRIAVFFLLTFLFVSFLPIRGETADPCSLLRMEVNGLLGPDTTEPQMPAGDMSCFIATKDNKKTLTLVVQSSGSPMILKGLRASQLSSDNYSVQDEPGLGEEAFSALAKPSGIAIEFWFIQSGKLVSFIRGGDTRLSKKEIEDARAAIKRIASAL